MIQLFTSMAYTFLVVSYLASSSSEALASLFGWRATMLHRTVRAMLNDEKTQLAQALYESPLISPAGTDTTLAASSMFGFKSTLPSYIDPEAFAVVVLHSIGLTDASVFKDKPPEAVREIITNLKGISAARSLQDLLFKVVERSNGDLARIHELIKAWFENATVRMTGTYKRRLQLSNFCIGLAMAIVFNISPFPRAVIMETHGDQAMVEAQQGTAVMAMPAAAISAATGDPINPSAAIPARASPVSTASAGDARAADAKQRPPGGDIFRAVREGVAGQAVLMAFGWLLTALSTLFGAPFWFTVLSKLNPSNPPTKGAGPEPKPLPGAAPPPPAAPPQP
jgi:hypothetical protein